MGADNFYEFYVIGNVINGKIQFEKYHNLERLGHTKICKKFKYSEIIEIPEIPEEDFKLLQPEPENEKGLQKFNFELMLHELDEEIEKPSNQLKGTYSKELQDEYYQKALRSTIERFGRKMLINTDIKLTLEEIEHKKTLKVTFNLRKREKNPLSQVQANFNFFNEKSTYSPKPIIEVEPYFFDTKSKRLNIQLAERKKTREEVKTFIEINNSLDTIENTILECYHKHLSTFRIEPTLSVLKLKIDNALQKLKNSQNRTSEFERLKKQAVLSNSDNFLESYDRFLTSKDNLSKSSISNYNKVKKHIIKFFDFEVEGEIIKKDSKTFTLGDFDGDVDEEFINYLVSCKLRNVTINQYLLLLLMFFKAMGISKKYRILKDAEREKDYLTIEEIEKFILIDVSDNSLLEFAKDICIFILYTGFRKSDVFKISKDNIKTRVNKAKKIEEKYVENYIQKTGKYQRTYLSSEAEEILIKYNYNLDFIGDKNRDINLSIKEILKRDEYFHQKNTIRIKNGNKVEEFKKERFNCFSAHSFRHSSATLIMSLGGNPNLVQNHLGHADFKMTKKYIHADEDAQLDGMSFIHNKK